MATAIIMATIIIMEIIMLIVTEEEVRITTDTKTTIMAEELHRLTEEIARVSIILEQVLLEQMRE